MNSFDNIKKNTTVILAGIWIAIVPLIVKLHIYTNPLKGYLWYPQTDKDADFFLYWKMVILVIAAIGMGVILACELSNKQHRRNYDLSNLKIFVPLVFYAALCILSALLSDYKYFCFNGMPEMYENMWTLLAYTIASIYFFWLVQYRDLLKHIFYLVCFGTMIVSLICTLQFFKLDIYKLIYSEDNVSFNFAPGQVYGPFYNINYVGSYIVLLFPLFICLTFMAKKIIVRLCSAVICVMYLFSIYGAQSSTGIIGLIASLLFGIWYLIFRLIKKKRWMIIYISLSVGCIILGSIAAFPYISAYIQRSDTQKTDLEHVYTRSDCVEINYKGHKLFIDMYDDGLNQLAFDLKDENNNSVLTEYLTGHGEYDYYYYQVQDARFPDFILVPSLYSEDPVQYLFQLTCDNSSWLFSKDVGADGTYYWMNGNMEWTKLTEENDSPDGIFFANMSSLANGRGFIWNKTLPLLKNSLILGSGPDTYALVFPNDDYVDLYNNGYQNMFHVKPHNMYLQTAVQTGILSLLCWLLFYLWYFIESLQLYCKVKLNEFDSICGFAIMIGTLGYMITGLANDSSVTVAPIYWALMGIGIGLNQKIKSKFQ